MRSAWLFVFAGGLQAAAAAAPASPQASSPEAPRTSVGAAPHALPRAPWLAAGDPAPRPWLDAGSGLTLGERLRGRIDVDRRGDGTRVRRITIGVTLPF